MKFLLLQELTDWEFPNHSYITDEKKEKAYGYFVGGTKDPVMFGKPMRFETKRRKFKVTKL